MTGILRWIGAALALAGLLGAEPGRRAELVVGSKAFPESHLLAEMCALLLEAEGFEVEHRTGLGGTLVCFTALRSGEIDLYPEYTGTGWSVILERAERASDPLQVFLEVQEESRERFDVEWRKPFGLNNTYALAMRSRRARELGVLSISDLRVHADSLRAGFSLEFLNREDGYPGLRAYYGLELEDVKGIEHGLAYDALESGALDLVDVYSTDGKLFEHDLRVLVDDRGFFPPYDAAPVVRGASLRRNPGIAAALDRLAFRVPDERMIRLNHAVEIGGRGFREVAREFLIEEGLLAPEGPPPEPDALARRGEGFLAFFAGRWRETLRLLIEHLRLTFLSVLLASLVAIPFGVAITGRPLAERIGLGATGAVQTVPSLALLAFLIAVPGLGLTLRSAICALTLYAVLPILRNTTTGLRDVDPDLVDAARGMGLTEGQILRRVRLPLATRTILAGVRTATVITVGFATLAAFIGAGGLGEPIVTGLYLNDPDLILAGALPAAVLALASDAVLGRLERWITPRGLRVREAAQGP